MRVKRGRSSQNVKLRSSESETRVHPVHPPTRNQLASIAPCIAHVMIHSYTPAASPIWCQLAHFGPRDRPARSRAFAFRALRPCSPRWPCGVDHPSMCTVACAHAACNTRPQLMQWDCRMRQWDHRVARSAPGRSLGKARHMRLIDGLSLIHRGLAVPLGLKWKWR